MAHKLTTASVFSAEDLQGFNMKPEFIQVEQGSNEWREMRVGMITASNFYYLMPHKKTGKPKDSRITYMNKLIAEVCTGLPEEINAKALEWGRVNETASRAAYEFESGETITSGGIVLHPSRRASASPDGLVKGKKKGLELKNPFSSETHIEFLLDDSIKDEYLAQCQGSLWICQYDQWAFASFDSRMKSHMLKIEIQERDEKLMKYFDEEIPAFIHDMDQALAKLGMSFTPKDIKAIA